MPILRSAVKKIPSGMMPLVRWAYCRYKGIGDRSYVARTGNKLLPPADLRFHVGSVDRENYMEIGRRCAEDLERGLSSAGRSWSSFRSVLDFGCGSGRTLAWLVGEPFEIHGSDLHAGCIDWCRAHFPRGTFRLNRTSPPLEHPGGAFDLVFSLSVFTHLDEEDQFSWLRELKRVTSPGALLLISTHGHHCWKDLPAADQESVRRNGILVKEAHALHGVFSKYFNTYHDDDYIRQRWREHFEVLDLLPRGINNHQDLVILRRA